MEEQIYTNSNSPMFITEEAKGYLLQTAKWCKFLAIIGFVCIGLYFLGGIAIMNVDPRSAFAEGLANSGNMSGHQELAPMIYGWTYIGASIFILAIYICPLLWMLRFSAQVKQAVASDDTQMLTEALKNQKKAYAYMGVLTIIGLGLILLFSILAAVVFAIIL